jgi:hypothetical protein
MIGYVISLMIMVTIVIFSVFFIFKDKDDTKLAK